MSRLELSTNHQAMSSFVEIVEPKPAAGMKQGRFGMLLLEIMGGERLQCFTKLPAQTLGIFFLPGIKNLAIL